MIATKNSSVCIGGLMDQDKRRFPSNGLRMKLMRENIGWDYLIKLYCKGSKYKSVEEQVEANYPALLPSYKDMKAKQQFKRLLRQVRSVL